MRKRGIDRMIDEMEGVNEGKESGWGSK